MQLSLRVFLSGYHSGYINIVVGSCKSRCTLTKEKPERIVLPAEEALRFTPEMLSSEKRNDPVIPDRTLLRMDCPTPVDDPVVGSVQ